MVGTAGFEPVRWVFRGIPEVPNTRKIGVLYSRLSPAAPFFAEIFADEERL